jgi:hypothetical protein
MTETAAATLIWKRLDELEDEIRATEARLLEMRDEAVQLQTAGNLIAQAGITTRRAGNTLHVEVARQLRPEEPA